MPVLIIHKVTLFSIMDHYIESLEIILQAHRGLHLIFRSFLLLDLPAQLDLPGLLGLPDLLDLREPARLVQLDLLGLPVQPVLLELALRDLPVQLDLLDL